MEFIVKLVIIFYLIFLVFPISMFVEVAREKGHYVDCSAGYMWALGLFFTPVLLGLYVCALPDRFARPMADSYVAQSGNEELPSI